MKVKKSLVIRGGTLIDATHRGITKNTAITVRGSIISAVRRKAGIPSRAEKIDASGKTIMPALIDVHVHLTGSRRETSSIASLFVPSIASSFVPEGLRGIRAAAEARKILEAGFVTVRDVGGTCALYLKKAIDEGTVMGPRIMAAGRFIVPTGGHGDIVNRLERKPEEIPRIMQSVIPIEIAEEMGGVRFADGTDECRKAVREQVRNGADLIKTCASGECDAIDDIQEIENIRDEWTTEELKAIVDEAHRLKKRVACHAYAPNHIKKALNAGVDTIEHGICLDDKTCQMIVEKKRIYVPTLAAFQKLYDLGDKSVGFAIESQKASIERARRMGVKIATGTDYFSHEWMGENAFELERMVDFGLSPMEAISAATKNSAEALGLDSKLGTIEPGKIADMIIVDGNPLEDIKILQDLNKILIVMKQGEIVVDRRS